MTRRLKASIYASVSPSSGWLERTSPPETAEQLSRDVGNALRAAGREALALRYATAFQRFIRTCAELALENDEGQINEAAQQAMNDALEDFERVESEVLAVFDRLDDEA